MLRTEKDEDQQRPEHQTAFQQVEEEGVSGEQSCKTAGFGSVYVQFMSSELVFLCSTT